MRPNTVEQAGAPICVSPPEPPNGVKMRPEVQLIFGPFGALFRVVKPGLKLARCFVSDS